MKFETLKEVLVLEETAFLQESIITEESKEIISEIQEKINQFTNEINECENIDDILLIVREHITEETVKSISGKIYITYFDVILCKQIVVNKYKSVDELLEIIKMSCHVPYVTDRKLVYNDRYIDGFYPYFFHKISTFIISNRIILND